eukprot:gene838-1157_t
MGTVQLKSSLSALSDIATKERLVNAKALLHELPHANCALNIFSSVHTAAGAPLSPDGSTVKSLLLTALPLLIEAGYVATSGSTGLVPAALSRWQEQQKGPSHHLDRRVHDMLLDAVQHVEFV